MQILIYEFMCSGGLLSSGGPSPANESFRREGEAMLKAVAADFAALGDVDVVVLRDRHFPDLHFPGCQTLDVGFSAEERDSSGAAKHGSAGGFQVSFPHQGF